MSWASVSVDGEVVGGIGRGWLVLLGVGRGDTQETAGRLAERAAQLRCFDDAEGKSNLSASDVGAEFLVVSQFTLYADVSRGRRPSFTGAAPPDAARTLVDEFAESLRRLGFKTEQGHFGAFMRVELANEGPYTVWLDTDGG